MMATWKWVNKNPQYHKGCLCRTLSASSTKWPRFFIQQSPREGTALPPLGSVWGLEFCPRFLRGLAESGFLQQQVPPLGPKSPVLCRTQFWRFRDSFRSQDYRADGSVSWKPRLSRLGFSDTASFCGHNFTTTSVCIWNEMWLQTQRC